MRRLLLVLGLASCVAPAHADDLAKMKKAAVTAAQGMSLSQQVQMGEESAMLMAYTQVCGFPGTNFSSKAALTGMMLLAKDEVPGIDEGFKSGAKLFQKMVDQMDQKTACGALMATLTNTGYLE
jgi:hypothetical protein